MKKVWFKNVSQNMGHFNPLGEQMHNLKTIYNNMRI